MRYLLCFIILFSAFGIPGADKKDFSVKVQQEKENITAGESIQLRVFLEYPADYHAAAWIATVFQPDVPDGFLKALNLTEKLSGGKRPEWRYVNLTTRWFPASKRNAKEQNVSLPTTKQWPVGDYRIIFRILFRQKVSPTVKTDKYISSPISFTIE